MLLSLNSLFRFTPLVDLFNNSEKQCFEYIIFYGNFSSHTCDHFASLLRQINNPTITSYAGFPRDPLKANTFTIY